MVSPSEIANMSMSDYAIFREQHLDWIAELKKIYDDPKPQPIRVLKTPGDVHRYAQGFVWRPAMDIAVYNRNIADSYEYFREMYVRTGEYEYLDKMLEKVEPYGD
jgi:hypothetical protein